MKIQQNNLEEIILEYAEQIKVLMSPNICGNMLLDCSKNELLILFLLYRNTDVNMTQIAEYIGSPLNTATGVVTRMETKKMLLRQRSAEDKRVVTIVMTELGKELLQDILSEILKYGLRVLEALTPEEMALAGVILDKIINVLKEDTKKPSIPAPKKLKKITIL